MSVCVCECVCVTHRDNYSSSYARRKHYTACTNQIIELQRNVTSNVVGIFYKEKRKKTEEKEHLCSMGSAVCVSREKEEDKYRLFCV